ncbi:MAG: agmatinase [candidate division Zixibacteria bacterium]|nr:agmatinase [candidate division Zixibacteria bacterium]
MIIFMGIENCPYEKAKAVIIPFGYEHTTTYLKGTSGGPRAILEASAQLELYDIETDSQPYLNGIHTMETTADNSIPPENAVKLVEEIISRIVMDNKFPVLLGGEHTITIGAVSAVKKKFPDLSVLQIDAHADLRDQYEGSRYSHACVMKRVSEIVPFAGVGIRSVGPEELDDYHRFRAQGRIITSGGFKKLDDYQGVVDILGDNVYITVDVDGLDPSVMPGVGTPEPDGLTFSGVMNLINAVAETKKIVGFDMVELRPLKDEARSEFTAAKMIYKTLAYIFRING